MEIPVQQCIDDSVVRGITDSFGDFSFEIYLYIFLSRNLNQWELKTVLTRIVIVCAVQLRVFVPDSTQLTLVSISTRRQKINFHIGPLE